MASSTSTNTRPSIYYSHSPNRSLPRQDCGLREYFPWPMAQRVSWSELDALHSQESRKPLRLALRRMAINPRPIIMATELF